MPASNKISLYWSEYDVQQRKDISFETIDTLMGFLINGRDETDCIYSLDGIHSFHCESRDILREIFTKYTTFFFVQKTDPSDFDGTIKGNLVCYTEEELIKMTIGATLELPNSIDCA